MTNNQERLRQILERDLQLMQVLRTVRDLNLPQGAVGAGYIRTAVWDHLCGMQPSPVDDIDVIYYDPADLSTAAEQAFERQLERAMPGMPWSVRNQARMAARNGDAPYTSLDDALRHWLETPTCVAVRLRPGGGMDIIAPFGLDDLFALKVNPTPRGRERAESYRQRVAEKRWEHRWPGVTVTLPQEPRK